MNYNITITRKKIKNIILKIKPDGKILLSVPKKISDSYIEYFLKSKEYWISKKMLEIEKKGYKKEENSFENGSKIFYLGQSYNLVIIKSASNDIYIEEDNLKIFIKDAENKLGIEKLIYNWYRRNALIIIRDALDRHSQLIGESYLELKIRKMKRRWGSCRCQSKVITMNIELMKKPIECIDYVALHELAHLRHPHHKREFWDFIYIYMPDWKKRKERMERYE